MLFYERRHMHYLYEMADSRRNTQKDHARIEAQTGSLPLSKLFILFLLEPPFQTEQNL